MYLCEHVTLSARKIDIPGVGSLRAKAACMLEPLCHP